MRNSKGKSLLALLLILVITAACGYVSLVGVHSDHEGSAANIKLGLDLAGGVSVVYQAAEENPSAEDMADTVYKLQKRVEVYSTEAEVYQEGSNRINVNIPGVYDAETILSELGNPGTVEFCEYNTSASATVEETTAEGETTAESETTETAETEDSTATTSSSLGDQFNVVLDGNDIADAQVRTTKDNYGNQEYVVYLSMTSDGAQKFADATTRNVGSQIYIIYDGEVISAPTVKTAITGGEATIDGMAGYDEANSLATTIRLGALKLNLNEIQSNVVGAKLGQEAVSTSLKAGAIGIGIVMVFMIVMYLIPGLASAIALVLYILSLLCFLNGLDITLTLPGIAGIILTIGMAVDANVIIFTRIREEIGLGRRVEDAIKNGFSKALSAILDGNITTLIAAAVLYIMGTGSIKGFATTLALGIVLSMFTALVITRILVYAFYGLGLKDKKFYGQKKAGKVFDFVGKKMIFYVIALVVIASGLVSMGVHRAGGSNALNYSLDFTGGTSMTVPFNEYIDITTADGTALTDFIAENAKTTDIQLQNVKESNDIIIKTQVLDKEQRAALKDAFEASYGVDTSAITEESISATVSSEMQRDAVLSVVIATVFMLIYIWIRFKDIKFGAGAIIALLHDVLVVLTVYAVIRIPVGNTFIACMLTIVGYSINATIVIFDRIRETRQEMPKESLDHIVNYSIAQTLSRSINTSLTTFVTIFMLYIMGVTSVKEFAMPLMGGIIAGAYSSVFLSGTIWYVLKKKFNKKK